MWFLEYIDFQNTQMKGLSFQTPKTEFLIQRILALLLKLVTSFSIHSLGSGTTAAIAHKMGRRYIGISGRSRQNALLSTFKSRGRWRGKQQYQQNRKPNKAVAVSNSIPLHQTY